MDMSMQPRLPPRQKVSASGRRIDKSDPVPKPVIKCHQPWPSSRMAHGSPISRRHPRSVVQNILSRFQMAKPARKIVRPALGVNPSMQEQLSPFPFRLISPVATNAHIVFSMYRALSASSASKAGRSCTSITQMLRNRTVAVRAA